MNLQSTLMHPDLLYFRRCLQIKLSGSFVDLSLSLEERLR